jgi:hypothetical protein
MANLEINLKGHFMICHEKDAPIVLQNSYLFQNFGSSELEAIANVAKRRFYEAGEIIFHEGDTAIPKERLEIFSISYDARSKNLGNNPTTYRRYDGP